jgi:WD40 repeat protein
MSIKMRTLVMLWSVLGVIAGGCQSWTVGQPTNQTVHTGDVVKAATQFDAPEQTPISIATDVPVNTGNVTDTPITPENSSQLEKVGSYQQSDANSVKFVQGNLGLAISSHEMIQIKPLVGNATERQASAKQPILFTVSGNQRELAWADETNRVTVWSVDENRELQSVNAGGKVTGLAFSADGAQFAIASGDHHVRVYSIGSVEPRQDLVFNNWLANLAFSASGSQLVGIDLSGFMARIIDLASGKEERTILWSEPSSPALYGAYLSPDWQKIAWVGRGIVQVMDLQSEKIEATLGHEDYVGSVTWSPRGDILATASARAGGNETSPVVILWDVKTGQYLKQIQTTSQVKSLSFSTDAVKFAVLDIGGEINIWTVPR